MDYVDIVTAVTLLVSFSSVIVALLALARASRFRSELALSEQLNYVPEILNKEYLDRQLTTPIAYSEIELHNLKQARRCVQKQIESTEDKSPEESYNDFLDSTLIDKTWENEYAYEVSIGLESVGIAGLGGALPLNLVFELCALLVVEDWGYCYRFVEEKLRRGPDALRPKSDADEGVIGLHRRHGEWLAYASAIYLEKHWEGEHLDQLVSRLGGVGLIQKKERIIREFHSDMTPSAVKKNIKKLLD